MGPSLLVAAEASKRRQYFGRNITRELPQSISPTCLVFCSLFWTPYFGWYLLVPFNTLLDVMLFDSVSDRVYVLSSTVCLRIDHPALFRKELQNQECDWRWRIWGWRLGLIFDWIALLYNRYPIDQVDSKLSEAMTRAASAWKQIAQCFRTLLLLLALQWDESVRSRENYFPRAHCFCRIFSAPMVEHRVSVRGLLPPSNGSAVMLISRRTEFPSVLIVFEFEQKLFIFTWTMRYERKESLILLQSFSCILSFALSSSHPQLCSWCISWYQSLLLPSPKQRTSLRHRRTPKQWKGSWRQ